MCSSTNYCFFQLHKRQSSKSGEINSKWICTKLTTMAQVLSESSFVKNGKLFGTCKLFKVKCYRLLILNKLRLNVEHSEQLFFCDYLKTHLTTVIWFVSFSSNNMLYPKEDKENKLLLYAVSME